MFNLIKRIYKKIRKKISSKRRKYKKRFDIDEDISIISCNCLGGLIYHDLNLKFLSPTINLFIETPGFIKMCLNLSYYMSLDLVESKDGCNYPVGILEDVKIHFLHYKNFSDAKSAWDRRKNRINYNKIYVIISDRDGFYDELLNEIDKIQYKKVFFSHIDFKKDYLVYVEKDKHKKTVGDLTDYINFKGQKKYEYYFDFEKWLSGNYSVLESKKMISK